MSGVGDEGYVINKFFQFVSAPKDQDLPTSGFKDYEANCIHLSFLFWKQFCSSIYTLYILKIYAQIIFYILKIFFTDFRER